MPDNRIRIIVEGAAKDNGDVRLSDFLKQLDAVRNALRQTERLLHEHSENSVYYRIVDASHASPLTMVLEGAVEEPAASQIPEEVVSKFLDCVVDIRERGVIPGNFDYPAAEAYRDIVTPKHKNITRLVIANGTRRVAVDEVYEHNIVTAIGPDEFADGSITGTLDTVRLHNTTTFEIFPTIGPKKVACYFRPDLKEKVKSALESYVRVYGRLRYKHWDKFPYAIDASDLDVYPPEDQLPTMRELRGMAPDLTDGLSVEQFLEKVRHGWQA
jgi:hypothetical protein